MKVRAESPRRVTENIFDGPVKYHSKHYTQCYLLAHQFDLNEWFTPDFRAQVFLFSDSVTKSNEKVTLLSVVHYTVISFDFQFALIIPKDFSILKHRCFDRSYDFLKFRAADILLPLKNEKFLYTLPELVISHHVNAHSAHIILLCATHEIK